MARTSAAALTVLLLCAGRAAAQDTLKIGLSVDHAVAAGVAHEYITALDAGDYVAGAVDQHGILVLAVQQRPRLSHGRGTLADGLIALVGTNTIRSSSR